MLSGREGRGAKVSDGFEGAPFPLAELRARLEEGAPLGPSALGEFAAAHGIPVAEMRAALGYYGDLARPGPAPRVCRGTSCHLHGGAEVAARLAARGARGAYCLGHCDRSPVVLDERGRVHTRCGGDAIEALLALPSAGASRTSVRCLAPEPIVTRRIGRGDFSVLARARGDGAWSALEGALRGSPEAVLDALERSGERGRGGSGFSTGIKWRIAASAPGAQKYVVANGDEGDPGSFVDRVLLEHDPHGILEGLALCAFAVGASRGVVFIRSEYPEAIARMERAVEEARAAGLLGSELFGSRFCFDVRVFHGLGSYVCGEETALLNAIEGRRGDVRPRPPYPVQAGLWGCPTVVNNVETLVNVPWIVERGPQAFAAFGTYDSRGTKAICLNAGFPGSGIFEVAFGASLRELLEGEGGLPIDRSHVEALLVGGPMGSVVLPEECDVAICYRELGARGIRLGHGGVVAVPAGADLGALLLHHLEFMARESCGKCVPCRAGSARAFELVRSGGLARGDEVATLLDVAEAASLCGFGQGMPAPLRRLLELARAQEEARR
jgi:NADH:ubiquinone oxidoreductase subunit F (NADH-binding)